jgi:hypothetical protein
MGMMASHFHCDHRHGINQCCVVGFMSLHRPIYNSVMPS